MARYTNPAGVLVDVADHKVMGSEWTPEVVEKAPAKSTRRSAKNTDEK